MVIKICQKKEWIEREQNCYRNLSDCKREDRKEYGRNHEKKLKAKQILF